MKYRNSARALALVLAGMLACPAVSAQAATFADMNNVPWPGAEKSIQKAADLKLVVGETINGKSYFKPKDPVSLTQSCQLAYKLLLETGKAKADAEITKKWSIVMDTYKIQSWAHPSVSYCLENGIIQISELSSFVNGEINVSATREQAAEILGRALEVGMPELKATASTTIFKDNASISADARPYIALLNSQKIVNGDDLGKFNPKSTLNRTETAVMVTNMHSILSKAASKPEEVKPTSVTGKVATLTKLYMNFENSNAYYLFPTSTIPVTLNGNTSSIDAVADLFKEGKSAMTAVVSLDGNSRVTAMAVTADAATEEGEAKAKEGILTSITYDSDRESGKLKIDKTSSWSAEKVYKIDIEIEDTEEEVEEYEWDDLVDLFEECKDNDEVIEVELTVDSDGNITKIEGKIIDEDDVEKEKDDASGTVASVTWDEVKDKGTIKIGSKTYTTTDPDDVEVDVEDGENSLTDWEELYWAYKDKKAMSIKIELENDEIVKVTGEVTEVKGYLRDFSDDSLTIEGKKSSEESSYEFDEEKTESIPATVKGKSFAHLEEFLEWLLDEEADEGSVDLEDVHEFDLTVKLKNGKIKEITGVYDRL